MFNAKDLSGWHTFLGGRGTGIDPKQVFTVLDGSIHISGEEIGDIATNYEYSNY